MKTVRIAVLLALPAALCGQYQYYQVGYLRQQQQSLDDIWRGKFLISGAIDAKCELYSAYLECSGS